jgi:DNA polymerase-1
MSLTLLIDGDQILYQCCAAVEHEVRWDDCNHVLYSNADEADTLVQHKIKEIIRETGATKYYLCFSGPNNFRKQLYPDYKKGRTRKPLCYGYLKDKLFVTDPCLQFDQLEADDVMGIWQTKKRVQHNDYTKCMIVSDDKDMLTVPGWHYRSKNVLFVSPDTAYRNFMTQVLTGDTADGYPGCRGIGKVKAQRILDNCGDRQSMWVSVVMAYEDSGLTEDDALVQARLARILQYGDWDEERQEVKLWKP